MKSRGWMMLLPVIFFLALGLALSDERWIIVALMVVFIIAPMVMSMIYTSYMLTPEARRAVLPKRLTVIPGTSIRIDYVSHKELEKSTPHDHPESSEAETGSTYPHDSQEPEKIPAPETIPWTDISDETSTSSFRIYRLKGKFQFIIIPWTAIPRDHLSV